MTFDCIGAQGPMPARRFIIQSRLRALCQKTVIGLAFQVLLLVSGPVHNSLTGI